METLYELLIERRRTEATAPASLADFVVTRGAPVEAEWLIQNPHISPYCLNAATSQAIFVEVAPEVNLATAPFVYNAQYEGAQRLFAMPYSQLLELGKSLETKLDRLILLFNISRCGSTLLHHILNQVPGVVSLSEPDAFIPVRNHETQQPEGEAGALMKAIAKFLFRPQLFPNLVTPVIKFHGRDLTLLNLCHTTFPSATLLFQYRDALSWVASWAGVEERVHGRTEPEKMPLDDAVAFVTTALWPISLAAMGLGNLSGPLSQAQIFAIGWLAFMECYLNQSEQGITATAWRYSDLNQRRPETLARLFATCGLPLDAVEPALVGYERDSQAGTVMARREGSGGNATRLTDEQGEEIRAIVRCHPNIQTPDYIAPNTVMEGSTPTPIHNKGALNE